MKSTHLAVLTILLAGAAPLRAQSPFDGAWKFDLSAAKLPATPFTATLKDGVFDCVSCDPKERVPADGAFHPVANNPAMDEEAITILGPRAFRIDERKGGTLIYTETDTVAPDGNTLTYKSESNSAQSGKVTRMTGTQVRVGKAEPGAHLASGSWRTVKMVSDTPDGLLLRMHVAGKQFTLSTGTGEHYSAMLGGPAVALQGARVPIMVSISQAGPRTLLESFERDGKVRSVNRFTVAPDGKTITMVHESKTDGSVTSYPGKKV